MNNTLIVCALKNELKVDETKFKILYTGVGKINAAISLTKYIYENNQIKNVINYGTAGSTKKEVGTLVDCTMFIQRDMDVSGVGFGKYMTPFDKKIPTIINCSSLNIIRLRLSQPVQLEIILSAMVAIISGMLLIWKHMHSLRYVTFLKKILYHLNIFQMVRIIMLLKIGVKTFIKAKNYLSQLFLII